MKLLRYALILLILWQLGAASWIHAKALLAQYLIADAWQATSSQSIQRPWAWADTWPVAKIELFNDKKSLGSWYVLNGTEGNALAFGPGWMPSSALPGEQGTTVIAAHRDTQFSKLNKMNIGDEIAIENREKQQLNYKVTNSYIIDSSKNELELVTSDANKLMLITCYPFDAITSGPLRYVLEATLLTKNKGATLASIEFAQQTKYPFNEQSIWF